MLPAHGAVLDHANSALSRRRPRRARHRGRPTAFGIAVALTALTFGYNVSAKRSCELPKTGAELRQLLIGNIKTIRVRRDYTNIVLDFAKRNHRQLDVDSTLHWLVNARPERAKSLLEQHHAVLTDGQHSNWTVSQGVRVLNKLAALLDVKADLPRPPRKDDKAARKRRRAAQRDEMVQGVLAEMRLGGALPGTASAVLHRGADVKRARRIVERYLEAAETEPQARPRVKALRLLHEHFQLAEGARDGTDVPSLRQAVIRFYSQSWRSADRIIADIAKAQKLEHSHAARLRYNLETLYYLAYEEGAATSAPPGTVPVLDCVQEQKLVPINATQVLAEACPPDASTMARRIPQTLTRLGTYLGLPSPEGLDGMPEVALTHLLGLAPDAADQAAEGFRGWLQVAQPDRRALKPNSAKQVASQLGICVTKARELNMIDWRLTPVPVDNAGTHRRRIDQWLGPVRLGHSPVDRILAGIVGNYNGTAYARVHELVRMVPLFAETRGAPRWSVADTEAEGVHRLVAWLINARSDKVGPLLQRYFQHVTENPHLVKAHHLNQVGLVLMEIQAGARKYKPSAAIAADDFVLPRASPRRRRDVVRTFREALRVADGTPLWVHKLIVGMLNQRGVGQRGRERRVATYGRWNKFLRKRLGRQLTLRQAIHELVDPLNSRTEAEALLELYLRTAGRKLAEGDGPRLQELLDNAKRYVDADAGQRG